MGTGSQRGRACSDALNSGCPGSAPPLSSPPSAPWGCRFKVWPDQLRNTAPPFSSPSCPAN